MLLELIVALELSESPEGQDATMLRRIIPILMGEKDSGGRYGAFPIAKVPRCLTRDAQLFILLHCRQRMMWICCEDYVCGYTPGFAAQDTCALEAHSIPRPCCQVAELSDSASVATNTRAASILKRLGVLPSRHLMNRSVKSVVNKVLAMDGLQLSIEVMNPHVSFPVRMYACMHVCMCACVHVCMRAGMPVSRHVRMYIGTAFVSKST